jgi:hypothetical protein
MKKLNCCIAASFVASLLASSVIAGVPLGGMTVAISPDGKTLVAGGDSRTLVIMDPESLEVKNRIWAETTITDLHYSKDGGTLLVGDSAERVLTYKTADWSKKSTLDKRDLVSVARDADIFAAMEEDYSNGPSVFFHSVGDNGVKGSMRFAKGDRVIGLGLNAEGTKVGVVFAGKDDPSEKKVEYKDIPKDLKEPARSTFQQQNDGKTGRIVFAEVPSGKILGDHTIYYTANSCDVVLNGDKACLVVTSGPQAMVAADGNVELFVLPQYGYGTGVSPDRKLIIAGGMGQFSITPFDPITPVNGKSATSLPGFPEYFKGFAMNNEGPIYAATTGYRVMRINRNGNVEKEAPIK